VSATQTRPPLPEWAGWRCDDCGQPMWDGSAFWTRDGKRVHTHGLDARACQRAARRTEKDLPVEYALVHQAVVEAEQHIGRFLCETSDDEWNDAKTLQGVLLHVYATLNDGGQGMRRYDVERAA
jgi:hypothetical protein